MDTNTYDGQTAEHFGVSATDPRWLAMVAREQRVAAEQPTTTPPCPSWCTLPAGHGYDMTGDVLDGQPVEYLRTHVAEERVDAGAWLEQRETNAGGVVTLDPPGIVVDVPSDDLTFDQALQLSRDVTAAAVALRLVEQLAS
jgi:hypothetical protein